MATSIVKDYSKSAECKSTRDALLARITKLQIGSSIGVHAVTPFGLNLPNQNSSDSRAVIHMGKHVERNAVLDSEISIVEAIKREKDRLHRFDRIVATQASLERLIARLLRMQNAGSACTCFAHEVKLAMLRFKVANKRCRVTELAVENHSISYNEISETLRCLEKISAEIESENRDAIILSAASLFKVMPDALDTSYNGASKQISVIQLLAEKVIHVARHQQNEVSDTLRETMDLLKENVNTLEVYSDQLEAIRNVYLGQARPSPGQGVMRPSPDQTLAGPGRDAALARPG